MPIYGFYHIACMNDWKPLVDEQMKMLSEVNMDRLFISVIYNSEDDDIAYIKSKLQPHWEIVKTSGNFKDYEFGILKYMRNLAENEDFLCFYLHTKGISITEKTNSFYPLNYGAKHLVKCVVAWRKYMEYFLFNDVEEIIELLKTHDAVGVAYTGYPVNHFSGNFWWSKSQHVKTLSPTFTDRWSAEFWIGKGNKANLKTRCPIQSSYIRVINESEYKK